jgi:predicted nucleic acid-binding protein
VRRYLLDTSIYSQPLRRRSDATVLRRWQQTGDSSCAVSIVSVAEVEWGLHKLASPEAWARFETLLRPRLTILPSDPAAWSRFARLKAQQMALGHPIADLDLLIAATAWVHDLTVVTLNLRHFSPITGLRVEDWSA